MVGLVPTLKSVRVANFHRDTIESLCEMLGAIGLESSSELRPWHIMSRISQTEVRHYGEIFEYLKEGDLLKTPLPVAYRRACEAASSQSFAHADA